MLRRDFMHGGLLASTSIMCCGATPAFADNFSVNDMCSTDVGSVVSRIKNQSASAADNDEDENDDAEDLATWQGVARKDLIWRPKDVKRNVDGVMHIAVGFAHNPGDAFKNKVIQGAQKWMSSGTLKNKVRFVFVGPDEECEIKVASSESSGIAEVNISKLGRAARTSGVSASLDPSRKATMIVHNTSSIEHEFGHVLGLGHEHTHPDILKQINMNKAIDLYAQPPNNWSSARTRRNFSATPACSGDQDVNLASVMLYPLPADITSIGVSLYGFSNIHERDRRCVELLYRV
ncbi:MAG: hypothetical protein ABJQ34_03960 [Paracoccaceae bacterium]